MSLDPDQFQAIDAALANAVADQATLASLRRLAAGLTVTRCDAADVRDETAFRQYTRCNLYLIDGRDHCWKITQDPECATGLVLASNGGVA